ncbi:MAG: zinc chelation protein SecC [bacterium]|nr:zinc chelation protein SecC [bacterium]
MPPEIPLPKTANAVSPDIISLCKKIAPGQRAVYLKIEPIAHSIVNECYENVARAIKQKGGTIQHGWQLWETMPGVMAEAEFHATWRDADGNLHDITPKEAPGITEILFLPDPSKIYSGRQIDNIRLALKDDPLVHAFIKTSESYFEVTNRGELANYYGELIATPEMEKIMQQKDELLVTIIQKFY